MGLKVYNTLSGEKEEFQPIEPGKVRLYVCGVTVYDMCHIGHARCYIAFDTVYRYLKYKGLDVTYVRNFTDVDDKIINRANELDVKSTEVSEKYIVEFHADMKTLGVAQADIEPKVTEHIQPIIDMVEKLIKNDSAYEVDGDVYFAVTQFPTYGKLSKRDIEDLQAGARVAVDERKRNPLDFALWKSAKPGEPAWESPWGQGRPGWHIECSAMSHEHLGESIDIHAGGKDLVFPHHENEIAQSEAASGKPFVKYWLHNGFVNIDEEKMSKSLGNFFTIREVLKAVDPQVLRHFLLTTHYRSPINFSDQVLKDAASRVDYGYETLKKIDDALEGFEANAESNSTDKKPGISLNGIVIDGILGKFENAMDDDFNSALAIANTSEVFKKANELCGGALDYTAKMKLVILRKRLTRIFKVLGVWNLDPCKYLDACQSEAVLNAGIDAAEVDALIQARIDARSSKNWGKADEIRDQLVAMKIVIKDSKDGSTSWSVEGDA